MSLSPLVKLLVILGIAKVTGERPITETKARKQRNLKIPIKGILTVIFTFILVTVTLYGLKPSQNDTTELVTVPILLSSDECLILQGEIESQASEFPNADYSKWQNSNCIKVCQDNIELNKYYQKQDFIRFLHDGCPYRKIILTDQECTTDKATDIRTCKKLILGELN